MSRCKNNNGFVTYLRLMRFLWNYRWQFICGVVGTIAASAIAAAFTGFLKPLIDKGFISPSALFVHLLPLIVILVYLGMGVTSLVGDYCMSWVARKIVMDLQKKVFMNHLHLASHDENYSESKTVSTLVYNIEQVTMVCTTVLMTLIGDGFYIPALVVVMFNNDWRFGVIFLATLPIIILINIITSKYMQNFSLRVQDAVASLAGVVSSKCNATNEFHNAADRVRREQVKIAVTNSLGVSGTRLAASLAVAMTIYLATSHSFPITLGTFVSALTAMLAIFKPLRNITKVNSALQKGIAGADSVFKLLEGADLTR